MQIKTPPTKTGAIYPIAESDIIVKDFEIPAHYPRAFGMDTGWNWTAAHAVAAD